MKATFYTITVLLAVLNISCNDDKLQTDNENINLLGNIVFQKISKHSLKTADVNSLHNSKSYGDALIYTRPIWSNDGTKFAAIELVSLVDESSYSSYFEIKIVNIEDETIKHWRIGDSKNINLTGSLTWSPDGKKSLFLQILITKSFI